MRSLAENRAKLGARQASMVAALVTGAKVSEPIDALRLDAAARALRRKRQRALVHAWPGLASPAREHFDAYAAENPLPRNGGPLADGRRFAAWLNQRGEMPDRCRLQVLSVDLRYISIANGLRPRCWPALKAIVLRRPRRLIIGVWLPWLGEKWLRFPLWPSRHG